MITLGDLKKVSELSSKILEIIEDKDELTQSDLQGAIEAVLLNAIQYGKGQR